MPGTYEKFGISLLYPENWQLTEDQTSRSPYEVSLQAPSGGLWMLTVYTARRPPADLLDEVLRSMRSEYGEVEFDSIKEEMEGTNVQCYEMNFCYLDFVVTAKAHSFSDEQRTYLVHTQAESREFDRLEPVFRAMVLSLLRRPL